jgi:hypothetical protein
MAAIDAEASATPKRVPGAAAGWLTGLFPSLSPRTMAVAASFATLVIGLQAFLLADVFTRPTVQPQSPAQSPGPVHLGLGGGSFAMVRFARQASAGEITSFLQHYQAAVVDGPNTGGAYRVRVAMGRLAKDEIARIVERMRRDRVVEFAAADE